MAETVRLTILGSTHGAGFGGRLIAFVPFNADAAAPNTRAAAGLCSHHGCDDKATMMRVTIQGVWAKCDHHSQNVSPAGHSQQLERVR